MSASSTCNIQTIRGYNEKKKSWRKSILLLYNDGKKKNERQVIKYYRRPNYKIKRESLISQKILELLPGLSNVVNLQENILIECKQESISKDLPIDKFGKDIQCEASVQKFIQGIDFYDYVQYHEDFESSAEIHAQVLCYLMILQKYLGFTHYDMHLGNILLKEMEQTCNFILISVDENKAFLIPSNGYEINFIDFEYSHIENSIDVFPSPPVELQIFDYLSDFYNSTSDVVCLTTNLLYYYQVFWKKSASKKYIEFQQSWNHLIKDTKLKSNGFFPAEKDSLYDIACLFLQEKDSVYYSFMISEWYSILDILLQHFWTDEEDEELMKIEFSFEEQKNIIEKFIQFFDQWLKKNFRNVKDMTTYKTLAILRNERKDFETITFPLFKLYRKDAMKKLENIKKQFPPEKFSCELILEKISTFLTYEKITNASKILFVNRSERKWIDFKKVNMNDSTKRELSEISKMIEENNNVETKGVLLRAFLKKNLML